MEAVGTRVVRRVGAALNTQNLQNFPRIKVAGGGGVAGHFRNFSSRLGLSEM